MLRNQGRQLGKAIWLATTRAVLLSLAAALAGGLFGIIGGLALCLTDSGAWLSAVGGWGLRGAFAGLVAGAIMGAISGIYHVDETPAKAEKPSVARNRPFLPSRPAAALYRRGARARQ